MVEGAAGGGGSTTSRDKSAIAGRNLFVDGTNYRPIHYNEILHQLHAHASYLRK